MKLLKGLAKQSAFWSGMYPYHPKTAAGQKRIRKALFWAGQGRFSPSEIEKRAENKLKEPPKPKKYDPEDELMDIMQEDNIINIIFFPVLLLSYLIKFPFKFVLGVFTNKVAFVATLIFSFLLYSHSEIVSSNLFLKVIPTEYQSLTGNFWIWIIIGVIFINYILYRHRKKIFTKLDNDKSLPQNIKEFKRLARKAFMGNVHAIRKMGDCYALGYGVNKDILKAGKLYRKAMKKGSMSARTSLGEGFMKGYDMDPDYIKAFYYLSKPARKGDMRALSLIYTLLVEYPNQYGFERWSQEYKNKQVNEFKDLAIKYNTPDVLFKERVKIKGDSFTYADKAAMLGSKLALDYMIQLDYLKKSKFYLYKSKLCELEEILEQKNKISTEIASKLPAKFNKPDDSFKKYLLEQIKDKETAQNKEEKKKIIYEAYLLQKAQLENEPLPDIRVESTVYEGNKIRFHLTDGSIGYLPDGVTLVNIHDKKVIEYKSTSDNHVYKYNVETGDMS